MNVYSKKIEYSKTMTLQQIIDYLKEGSTNNVYKQRTVATPTIYHMIRGLEKLQTQTSNQEILKKTVEQNNKTITQLTNQITKLVDENQKSNLSDKKIQEINRLYKKLMNGEIQLCKRQFRNCRVSLAMPWIEQLMNCLVEDYTKLRKMEKLLSELCNNNAMNETLLTEKCIKHIQIISKKFQQMNKNNQTKTNKTFEYINFNNTALNYEQSKIVQQLCSALSKGDFQKYKNDRQSKKFIFGLQKVFQTMENDQLKLQKVLWEMYKVFGSQKPTDQCQKSLVDKCMEIVNLISETLHSNVRQLNLSTIGKRKVSEFVCLCDYFDCVNLLIKERKNEVNQIKVATKEMPHKVDYKYKGNSNCRNMMKEDLTHSQQFITANQQMKAESQKQIEQQMQNELIKYIKQFDINQITFIINKKKNQSTFSQKVTALCIQRLQTILSVPHSHNIFEYVSFLRQKAQQCIKLQQKLKTQNEKNQQQRRQQNKQLQQIAYQNELSQKQFTQKTKKMEEMQHKLNQQNLNAKQTQEKLEELKKLQRMYQKDKKQITEFLSKCKDQLNIEQQPSLSNISQITNKIDAMLENLQCINTVVDKLKEIEKVHPQLAITKQNQKENQLQQTTEKFEYIMTMLNCFNAVLSEQQKRNRVKKICDSSTMFSTEQHETSVAEALQHYLKREEMQRYNLLYRSKVGGNINELLKGKPNILLIVSTKHGQTIAVYSSLSYCETVNTKETKGLLISTHSGKAYQLKKGKNPIKSDKQRIIIGNGEISISKHVNNDSTMETNFDIESAFEITKKDFYDIFGQQKAKQIQINGFEIYEIELRQKEIVENKTKKQKQKQSQTAKSNIDSVNFKAMEKENKDLKEKVERYQKVIKQLKAENEQLKTEKGLSISQSQCETEIKKDDQQCQTNHQKQQIELAMKQFEEQKTLLMIEKERVKQLQEKQRTLVSQKEELQKQNEKLKQRLPKHGQQTQSQSFSEKQAQKYQKMISQQQNDGQQQQQSQKQSNNLQEEYVKLQKQKQFLQKGTQFEEKSSENSIRQCEHSQNGHKDLHLQSDEREKLGKLSTQLPSERHQLRQSVEREQNHSQISTKRYHKEEQSNISEKIEKLQNQLQISNEGKQTALLNKEQQQNHEKKNKENENVNVNHQQHQKNEQKVSKINEQPLNSVQQQIQNKQITLDTLCQQIQKQQSKLSQLNKQIMQKCKKTVTMQNESNDENDKTHQRKVKQQQQQQLKKLANLKKDIEKQQKMIDKAKEENKKLSKQKTELQNKLKTKTNQLNKNQKQLNIVKKQLTEIEEKLKKANQHNESAMKQMEQFKVIIDKEQAKLQQLRKQQRQLTQRKSKLEEQCLSKETTMKQMQNIENKCKELTNQFSDKQKQVESVNQNLESLKQQKQSNEKIILQQNNYLNNVYVELKKCNQSVKEAKNQVQSRTIELKEIEVKRNKAAKQLTNIEQEIAKLSEQKEQAMKVTQQREQLIKIFEEEQPKLKKLRNQFAQLSEKKKKLEQSQSNISNTVKEFKQQYENLKKSYANVENNLRNKQKQLSNTEKKMEQTKVEKQKIERNTEKQKKQLETLKASTESIKNQFKSMQQQYANIKQKMFKEKLKYGLYPNRLFIGSILHHQQNRQYIIDRIEQLHKPHKITKTKLLYSLALMKIQNPHHYIDGINNYVVIIELEKQKQKGRPYIVALYSEWALKPNDVLNTGKGFISSVNNKKVFYLVKGDETARLTQYSDYYIVFGKGQIQFKIMNDKNKVDILDLNIGHQRKSLQTGTWKNSEVFTGEVSQHAKIKNYQVYGVGFEEEKEGIDQ